MSKTKKILLTAGASVGGLILVVALAAVIIVQTAWFSNFVRAKLIATVQESTGGRVELQSFSFDARHLTIWIRGFVLHGTEPTTAQPLAKVATVEIRLRLFSGIFHTLDLAYIGVQDPQLNVITFPDGTTNIPSPKVQQKSTNGNTLQTLVDLKIGEFLVQNGLLTWDKQPNQFSGRGENLHAVLNFRPANQSYAGTLSIEPLQISAPGGKPLGININLPVEIDANNVHLTNGRLYTPRSNISVTASLHDINNPSIKANMKAALSVPEIRQTFNLPLDLPRDGSDNQITADFAGDLDQKSGLMEVQSANVVFGRTSLQASGRLRDPNDPNGAVHFSGNVSLDQLSAMLAGSTTRAGGMLVASGQANLDGQNNYRLEATVSGNGLSVRSGSTDIRGLSLYIPVHADPAAIRVDELKAGVLGGSLTAKASVAQMRKLTVDANLRGFSLPVVAAALGEHLNYDGTLNGAVNAAADLQSKKVADTLTASMRLGIVPGRRGVPIRGDINASYFGASDDVEIRNPSYLAMPNSRLDLAGSLNRNIQLKLVSRNLQDFQPLLATGVKGPAPQMPLALRANGSAVVEASIAGGVSRPQISGHLALNNFSVEQRPFDALSLDVAASPSGASLQNGTLSRASLLTKFQGSLGLQKWSPVPRSPLNADLTMRNASVADLLSLAGESDIPATGDATADIHVSGTYGNPLGSAAVQIANGTAYQQPFSSLRAQVNLQDQLITLSPLELVTDAGSLSINANYHHPRDSFLTGNANLRVTTTPIQLQRLKQLQEATRGLAGSLQLNAAVSASVRQVQGNSAVDVSDVNADLSATGLQLRKQDVGNLTFTARTANRQVNYQLVSNFAASNINVTGQTVLANDYPTTATANIQDLSLQKALTIAGEPMVPVTGTLSLNAHVNGTVNSPKADATFTLANATAYQEKVNRLAGSLHYTDTLINVPSLQLDAPAGTVTVAASFAHPASNFDSGTLTLSIKTSDVSLAKIEHVRAEEPTIGGTLRLAFDMSGKLAQGQKVPLALTSLSANLGTNGLELNNRALGSARLSAATTGSTLNFQFDSDIAKSRIHADGTSQLTGMYPTAANLTFADISYGRIAPFISSDPSIRPAFDASVEGQASVNGPLLDVDALTARLELSKVAAHTLSISSPTGGPARRTVGIQNQQPVVISLKRSVLNIEQLKLVGDGTNLSASGTINLGNTAAPLNVQVAANMNLSALQDVDRDFYSNGTVDLNAAIHGSFDDPLVNGRVELKNANVNYAEAPNGLSNANGVILLSGRSATIQNLTGETGGGKITVTGFAGYSAGHATFNLKAAANKVRVRYSGISLTSNASFTFTGSSERSLLGGNVTVSRIAYNSSSDVGSLLSSFASTPPSTPSAPSPLLSALRLDIRVLTAPDLRVITAYADRLAVEANLTVRGTAETPGVLGRVTVTEGELVFFGNTYTVNTGTIGFYNPTVIQPVLNISLETLTQGVDVTLSVSGPVNNLQLTYTSDPPLTFEQIVELLATNTTPNNPTIAANQPQAPQQSFTQMGESAILGQAIANPLASRIQRVFGLSQFKIDPTVAGNGGSGARVTLQQKIASNITFTYISDVTQTNSEIIRVDWDLTPKFSAVGLRDYNGNVSIEFFYKFKVR